jgi:hypothetical protein
LFEKSLDTIELEKLKTRHTVSKTICSSTGSSAFGSFEALSSLLASSHNFGMI